MGHIRFEFIKETNRETSKNGTAIHRYLLQYAELDDYTPLKADMYVLTNTPILIGGYSKMLRKSITWEPVESHGPRYSLGFFVNVNYSVPETGMAEDDALYPDSATPVRRIVSRRFYGEDETIKIETARNTRIFYSENPFDTSDDEKKQVEGYGNFINPSKEGPQGIDMPFSRFAWEENWTFSRSLMSDPYVLAIPNLKNHTNEYAFRGFKPNEVKLVEWTVDDPIPQTEEELQNARVNMAFRFIVEPTAKIKIGKVEEFTKHGWEYVSPVFREIISEDQKTTTSKIVAVRVQELYDKADFGRLEIE